MKRDGALKSIWQQGIEQYEPTNAWDKGQVYDLLIVGGGITGLTTALLLQSEGKKCILAEAVNIGYGTTGGTTAHLNTIADTTYDRVEKNFSEDDAKLVAASMREAIDLVEGLITKYAINCDFAYKPAYLFAETDIEADELDKIRKASQKAGVVIACSDSLPVPMSFLKACRFEMQAQLHATKYLQGLAKAYEAEGGVLLQNCLVQSHDKTNGYYEVNTSLGSIKAERIMYATHIPPGINILHFRCAPYRSYAAAFTLKSGEYPDALIYDMKEPYNYYRSHVVDGKKYIIGGGFDHKTGHEKNTEQVFRKLEAHLRHSFDVDEVVYKWSSQYFNAADGLPYIGLLPGYDDIYVGTGYSGNGMTFGSIGAKIICELITNKESRYEKLYNPNRVKPIAGFADFVRENADVISKFIGMRFSYEKVTALAELAPGDAMLADWEGNKVALYKDESGKVHALDPVCPHAKCLVEWNNAEKSWDCPCHGSRFGTNGALLTGPATKGLTQIKWEGIDGD
jgi:glycine/D-amino acid oxidase-like deaminating enzyme/nitrite reductase/ring-hydroxylating ferredoxin subunit